MDTLQGNKDYPRYGVAGFRIGVDIRALDTPYITGVDTYLRRLLEFWIKQADDCEFTLLGTPGLRKHELVKEYLNSGHRFMGGPFVNKYFNASLRFLKLPKLDKMAGNVDVFFLPNPMFHAFSREAKTVLTIHDLSFERLRSIYSFKRNLWHKMVNPGSEARFARRIIAVSDSTARDLVDIYKVEGDKIDVVPLGVDRKTETDKNWVLPQNYILFLGNVEPRKNLTTLIVAFQNIKKNFPNLKLVVAGSFFPQKDNRAMAYASKSSDVQILGPVSDDYKFALYRNAKMLVLPSFYEGFGLPILEAQSMGTPVITSVGSSMPQVSGGGALLINPLNVKDLESAIKLILTDDELKNKLIGGGGEVASRYSWQKTAK